MLHLFWGFIPISESSCETVISFGTSSKGRSPRLVFFIEDSTKGQHPSCIRRLTILVIWNCLTLISSVWFEAKCMQRRLIHTVFFQYFGSEACTSVPISQDQSCSIILTISRFISSCNQEQIRLAPEKCKSSCKLTLFLTYVITAVWNFDIYYHHMVIVQSPLFARGSKIKLCLRLQLEG